MKPEQLKAKSTEALKVQIWWAAAAYTMAQEHGKAPMAEAARLDVNALLAELQSRGECLAGKPL